MEAIRSDLFARMLRIEYYLHRMVRVYMAGLRESPYNGGDQKFTNRQDAWGYRV